MQEIVLFTRILTLTLGFERAIYGSQDGLFVSIDEMYILLFLNYLDKKLITINACLF